MTVLAGLVAPGFLSSGPVRVALALGGITHFVVACPKDVSMFSAAVTALGVEDRLRVVDMTDLLVESVRRAAAVEEMVVAPS